MAEGFRRAGFNFYPRSPCGERRFELSILHPAVLFLSTLSLRRATPTLQSKIVSPSISIHALLAESDMVAYHAMCRLSRFLSTLSLRRATLMRPGAKTTGRYFYPRSPCGERHLRLYFKHPNVEFLSTLSLRRATTRTWIMSHPPPDFYPRSPCGERPQAQYDNAKSEDFYPRSPCGERHTRHGRAGAAGNFYPRSPCGERPLHRAAAAAGEYFYPRSPCGERPE